MAENSKENAQRIQTSLLNPYEKVILQWMAVRMPRWVKSDHLSLLGLVGAFVIAIGYALTNLHVGYMWLACFGFFLNWLGDSLDGTLARVRKAQRPIYGFYIDHNLDCICEFLMVGGAGLSPYLNLTSSLLLIVPYFMLEVYVMINAHLKNEFKLTYSKLGPTELRIIICIVNLAILFSEGLRNWHIDINMMGEAVKLQFLDIFCLSAGVIMLVMYITSLIKDGKYYAEIDPLKK